MKNLTIIVTAVLAVILLTIPAHATSIITTVDVKFVAAAACREVTLQADLDNNGFYEKSAKGAIGTYELKWKDVAQNEHQKFGFCVEPDQNISEDYKKYDVRMPKDGPVGTSWRSGPMGITRENLLRELWGRFFDSSWTDGSYGDADRDNAAGFGLAVHEIIYETIMDSMSLVLDATADVFCAKPKSNGDDNEYALIANVYLSALTGDTTKFANLLVLTNGDDQFYEGYQDYLVEIPEPGTALMSGLGVLGILGLLRRI